MVVTLQTQFLVDSMLDLNQKTYKANPVILSIVIISLGAL